jgi:hypothetical protein
MPESPREAASLVFWSANATDGTGLPGSFGTECAFYHHVGNTITP